MTGTVQIDGNSLTLEGVVAVAGGAKVVVAPSALHGMQQSREVVESLLRDGKVVYGVTTGFGKLSDVAVPAERLAELQVNMIRSHAAGVGTPLPEREVRVMMLLRANVLAKGLSGGRPELVQLLTAMLNAGLYPTVPEQGSVGASGDLAPLSHLALTMMGEGELHRDGATGPAAELLAAAGLSPVSLQAKEGISLVNGTQAHTAIAALSLHRAQQLWNVAHLSGAASLEALLGTPDAFDDRIAQARGQAGQIVSAALLRALLADSEIRESHRHGDPRVQDAYSLRCMPQVHGPVLDALNFARDVVQRELNAGTDNPLVFGNGDIVSGGNFHGLACALAMDVMAIAITNLVVMAERRIDRLVHPDLNQGLPAFLASDAGVNSGFMMAQVTAAALTSECKLLAHPASVDSIPTDGGKEDVVPMAMTAAWKLRRVLDNAERIIAIELLCAMQGLDYRLPLRAGAQVMRGRDLLRTLVPPLAEDRVLSTDIEKVASAMAAGLFAEVTA